MNLSKFSQQLVRDMKASAAKTGVLGLLLLVGLYFWLPPLLKAFSGDTPATPTPAPVASSSTTATGSASTTPNPTTSPKKPHDSADITKLLHEHPLMQPAKAEDMPEKPFGLDEDLIPLPVEIAEDSLAEPPPPPSKPKPKPIERLDGLTLKSTLVGPTRRAAMINNRLFHEGQLVPWNDKQLRLESVSRKSVTLTDGSQSWQLTLKDSRGESEE
ncbi:MAG: hypothetical protein IAG10_05350 [Planctomycetaceae bacterium]|nr:hypothetical protein [Planctomycetaceae bacterium]